VRFLASQRPRGFARRGQIPLRQERAAREDKANTSEPEWLKGCLKAGILTILCPLPGGSMDSTSHTLQWTPYEVKAASITYERKTEDLQLEQLRLRLHKMIQRAEGKAPEPAAA
jgi:hypothetical protein